MSAQIINLHAWRVAHPGKAVRVRLVYDPLWMWRVWLAMWGIQ